MKSVYTLSVIKVGCLLACLFLLLLIPHGSAAFCGYGCSAEEPNCPYVDIMSMGSVNGFLGANLVSSITNMNNYTNTTTSVQNIFGRGDLSYFLERNITSESSNGELDVLVKGSRVLISDAGYTSGCTTGEGCNESYCDQISSKITADLSSGSFQSITNLTPIGAEGGIIQKSYVQGNGGLYADSKFESISGFNCTVSQEVLIEDRVKMLGTEMVFGREVSLISKH